MKTFLLAAIVTLAMLSTAAAADAIKYKVIGPINVSKIPYISDEERENIKRLLSDPATKSTLVLAISKDGTARPWWGKDRSTKDRFRSAMQICEHISGGPCGLAAVNGKMVQFKEFPRQITYPEKFDVEAVPFVRQRDLAKIRRVYANQRRNRALALNWDGYWAYSYGQNSERTARKNALTWCRKGRVGWGHCFLYDVNGRVVFNPDTDIYGVK